MGIDTHSLNLLRHAAEKHGGLGNTITLGRLAVLLGPRAAKKWAGATGGAYCESMLVEKFGATHVDSIDNSGYEGATIISDMNQPVPETLTGRYDTVLDFGCTEHIFDVAQSLRNVSSMCKPEGMILHAVPANGFCGHGFYQFSPELFFSWYSTVNGYTDTEIYLADLMDTKHWYHISKPKNGERINVRSSDETYVLVVTKKMEHATQTAQQSDYAFTWAHSGAQPAKPHAPGHFANIRELLLAHRNAARLIHRAEALVSNKNARPASRHPACNRIRVPSS